MQHSTSFHDAIMRPKADAGGRGDLLAPALLAQFLVRERIPAPVKFHGGANEVLQGTPLEQRTVREDPLVRLPSIRLSELKVKVLQKWVGRVDRVFSDRFVATLNDASNRNSPIEQIELMIEEVPPSDRPLLVVGATFYWSIGYVDSPDGQRDRTSSVRFARQPRLTATDVVLSYKQADELVRVLESD